MSTTKKIIIHDNGCGDAPTGRPTENIVNPPLVAAMPIAIAAEKPAPTKPVDTE